MQYPCTSILGSGIGHGANNVPQMMSCRGIQCPVGAYNVLLVHTMSCCAYNVLLYSCGREHKLDPHQQHFCLKLNLEVKHTAFLHPAQTSKKEVAWPSG